MTVAAALHSLWSRAARAPGPVVVLTGAGVSAASGIPTFRGRDGYWTVGSTQYTPQEMATLDMFGRHPEVVWGWYLYRRGVCLQASPNVAHTALVELERALGDRELPLHQVEQTLVELVERDCGPVLTAAELRSETGALTH